MARPKGTAPNMGQVYAATQLGFPLTVREIAAWAKCDSATARNLLLELQGQGRVMRWRPRNEQYDLWLATTMPANHNETGLMLIAMRMHKRLHPDCDVVMGANFVECLTCGRHAHFTGTDPERPLLLHSSEHRSGKQLPVRRTIRPQDL